MNSSVTSGVPGASITNRQWFLPGQAPISCSTIAINSSGIFTLQVEDSYNGCIGTKTIQITDSRPQFGLAGTAPTSSNSCDGSLVVNTQVPNGYSLSATAGSLNGIYLNNLCYGWVKVCMTYTNSGCFKCDSLLMNGATFVEERELENEIMVFPNPAAEYVQIKYPIDQNGLIRIFNLEGQEVRTLRLENDGSTMIEGLKEGFYFVEISSELTFVRRFLTVIRP